MPMFCQQEKNQGTDQQVSMGPLVEAKIGNVRAQMCDNIDYFSKRTITGQR